MLSIKIIASGEFREKYLQDAAEEYKKRLSSWCELSEYIFKENKLPENPNNTQIEESLKAEEKIILDKIPPRSFVIAMCIEGKQFSSEELAVKFQEIQNLGFSEMVFVIGSSYGLSQKIKDMANLRMSVSKLTFPHRLFRVMLYETIYRSLSINNGSKYHK